MLDLKKYKRFFAFGCSMTSYYWPTWADIISREIPESYNYGQSGGGTLFISSQVTEANLRYQFDQNDLVMVMWSSIAREDRYRHGQWITPGNIYTQNYFDDDFVKAWADTRGYLIRDLSVITMCKKMLDSLNVDYHMLNMSPFVDNSSTDLDVTDFFKETLDEIYKDILTVEYNGVWPQHPIRHNSGQTADYHPSTAGHARYLQKTFSNLEFTKETNEFILKYENIIMAARNLNEVRQHWSTVRPSRL